MTLSIAIMRSKGCEAHDVRIGGVELRGPDSLYESLATPLPTELITQQKNKSKPNPSQTLHLLSKTTSQLHHV